MVRLPFVRPNEAANALNFLIGTANLWSCWPIAFCLPPGPDAAVSIFTYVAFQGYESASSIQEFRFEDTYTFGFQLDLGSVFLVPDLIRP